jgi:hypothetical protein
MATSQNFNKPRVNYKQVNRKKKQEKAKRTGKAEVRDGSVLAGCAAVGVSEAIVPPPAASRHTQKGKHTKLKVSAVRTKKHTKKVEHRQRMADRAVAATTAAAAAQEPVEVKMNKPRAKKARAKKSAGPASMEE